MLYLVETSVGTTSVIELATNVVPAVCVLNENDTEVTEKLETFIAAGDP